MRRLFERISTSRARRARAAEDGSDETRPADRVDEASVDPKAGAIDTGTDPHAPPPLDPAASPLADAGETQAPTPDSRPLDDGIARAPGAPPPEPPSDAATIAARAGDPRSMHGLRTGEGDASPGATTADLASGAGLADTEWNQETKQLGAEEVQESEAHEQSLDVYAMDDDELSEAVDREAGHELTGGADDDEVRLMEDEHDQELKEDVADEVKESEAREQSMDVHAMDDDELHELVVEEAEHRANEASKDADEDPEGQSTEEDPEPDPQPEPDPGGGEAGVATPDPEGGFTPRVALDPDLVRSAEIGRHGRGGDVDPTTGDGAGTAEAGGDPSTYDLTDPEDDLHFGGGAPREDHDATNVDYGPDDDTATGVGLLDDPFAGPAGAPLDLLGDAASTERAATRDSGSGIEVVPSEPDAARGPGGDDDEGLVDLL